MQNLQILKASRADQTEILSILLDTQQWLWSQGINQWTLPFTADWIQESIENKEFFVGTIDNQIVAVFRLINTDEFIWSNHLGNAIYIHSLAINSRWRGQGIGDSILDWIESFALKSGQEYLRLDCMAENKKLCGFYEKAGFVKRGVKEIQNESSIYKAQLFEKLISPKSLDEPK